MNQIDKVPFIFLTSHPFSGSTLVSFLLGSHPEIATVGELTGPSSDKDLTSYPCSCGRLFQQDPFWQQVAEVVNGCGISYSLDKPLDTRFDLGATPWMQRLRTQSLRSNRLEAWRDQFFYSFWPGHRRQMRERAERNEAFARAVLEITGKSVFLDTSKDPMRIRYLQLAPNIDLYVIHLVRDVRGVATSIMRRHPDVTGRKAAKSWLMREKNIRRHLDALPRSHWIRVTYEALATDTLPTLNQILKFIGVYSLQHLVDFRETEQHILGNKMRKRTSSTIKLDERWRTELAQKDLEVIERLVGI